MKFAFSRVTHGNVVKLRQKPSLPSNKIVLLLIAFDLVEQELSACYGVIGEPHRHCVSNILS